MLKAEETKMLAPEGALAVKKIAEAFETEDYSLLPAYLALAVAEAEKACEGGAAGKGAEVGAAFEKALYAHLFEICKGAGKARRALRGALKEKADLTNLVTALRSGSAEAAVGQYVPCGYLAAEDFSFCFAENAYAAGDVSSAIQQTWTAAQSQVKTVVENVVFPVIDMILAVLFFVKLGTAYFDYRKHGQFEFTAPCILFACLLFTLTAPLYIWNILG